MRSLLDEVASGARPSGWIVPSRVALRAEPAAAASIRGELRRGMAVQIEWEAGGWARVRAQAQPSLEGFVPSRAIGPSDAVRSPGPHVTDR